MMNVVRNSYAIRNRWQGNANMQQCKIVVRVQEQLAQRGNDHLVIWNSMDVTIRLHATTVRSGQTCVVREEHNGVIWC